MTERNEPGERRPAEGVRIIGPEEAQAALDAGAAAGRRADDELRFGDVPPAPAGPRSPHRFPLPDSVDPAGAVPRPPVVAPAKVDPMAAPRFRHAVRAEDAHDPRPWHEREAGEVAGAAAPPEPHEAAAAAEAAAPGGAPTTPAALGAVAPSGVDAYAITGEQPVLDLTTSDVDEGPTVVDVPTATEWPESAAGPDAEVATETAEPAWLRRARAPWPETPPPPAALAPEGAGAVPSDEAVAAVPDHEAVTGPVPLEAIERPTPPPGAARIDAPLAWADPTVPLAASPSEPVAAEPPDEAASGSAGESRIDRRSRRRANPNRRSLGDVAAPEEGSTVSAPFGGDLPHWTDPPTGEVPRILADRAGGGDDDLAAWEALGSRSNTWRDDSTGWQHVDDGLDDLVDDEAPLGALDTTRTEHSDIFSFDEDFERLEEERSGSHRVVAAGEGYADFGEDEWQEQPAPLRVGSRPRPLEREVRRRPRRGGGPNGPTGPGGTGGGATPVARRGTADLGPRVAVGVGLVVLLLIAIAIGPVGLLVLAAAIITAAGAEVYDILRPSGFRPATLLGLTATVGVVFAAYWHGISALPLVTVLVFAGSMCWYLFKVVDARPLANAAVTTTAFVWVGLLGSFAALLLREPHGRGLLLGAVIPAVADDIVAFFTGRRFGSRLMAPSISPAKTWEGAIGGGIAAVVAGAIVGHSLSPWGGVKHGVVLGVAIGVLAPIGDLFESMVKRDLSIKDSGRVLSAHGGVLDRFDAVLLVLPFAYYLASWWHLIR